VSYYRHASYNNISNKFIAGDNNTGEQLLMVSLTLVIYKCFSFHSKLQYFIVTTEIYFVCKAASCMFKNKDAMEEGSCQGKEKVEMTKRQYLRPSKSDTAADCDIGTTTWKGASMDSLHILIRSALRRPKLNCAKVLLTQG
jgi:hypothetical protein